jgi:HSP20 family protein
MTMAEKTQKTAAKTPNTESKATPATGAKPAAPESPARAMSPFEEMEQAFERVYGRFFPRGWMRPSRWDIPHWGDLPMLFEGKHPKVDVIDRDDDILVKAEIPGVEKKDLDVTMTDNSVTIKGTVSHEKEVTKGDYYRKEISRGSFSRTVALPADVEGTKAEANYKDGVLELIIPKVTKSRRRKVTVK